MAFHIIGDQDTVLGFRFAGVTGSIATTAAEAGQALRRALDDKECQILLLTERVERLVRDEAMAQRLAATPPYVVVIEDLWGPESGRKTLPELIAEAVGIRIVSDGEGRP
jgi:vacuolar-type H+-ATPase subunit F/Vma7